MGDFIRLQKGAPPWEGSGDPAHHVETYHFHDIPLIGLIQQHGVNYLFRCFAGEVEPLNLWSYTLVEDAEIVDLEETTTAQEFDRRVNELASRPGVLALSVDGIGIVASREVQDWSDPESNVGPLLRELDAFQERFRSNVDAQRRRLVGAV